MASRKLTAKFAGIDEKEESSGSSHSSLSSSDSKIAPPPVAGARSPAGSSSDRRSNPRLLDATELDIDTFLMGDQEDPAFFKSQGPVAGGPKVSNAEIHNQRLPDVVKKERDIDIDIDIATKALENNDIFGKEDPSKADFDVETAQAILPMTMDASRTEEEVKMADTSKKGAPVAAKEQYSVVTPGEYLHFIRPAQTGQAGRRPRLSQMMEKVYIVRRE